MIPQQRGPALDNSIISNDLYIGKSLAHCIQIKRRRAGMITIGNENRKD